MRSDCAHLLHAHQVAGLDVALRAGDHVELEAVVDRVRVRAADVVGHAGGAQHRPGHGGVDGILGAQVANALDARDQHLVLGQQAVHLLHFAGQPVVDQFVDLAERVLGHVAHHAAEAEVVAHHARTGDRLEDIQDQFAFLEGVQRGGVHGAQVVQEHAQEDQVVLDAARVPP